MEQGRNIELQLRLDRDLTIPTPLTGGQGGRDKEHYYLAVFLSTTRIVFLKLSTLPTDYTSLISDRRSK